jgi:AcrR family transcriptional regulator
MAALPAKSIRPPAGNDETRARLLAAAAEVFAESGYHGATVREICTRANVNVALINYHFGDKLELYTEVLRRAFDDPERMKGMQELLAQKAKPEIVLRKVIHLMLNLMIRRRERGPLHMRLMLHELTRPTPAIGRVIDETVKPLHDRVRDLLGQILRLPSDHDRTRLCAQSIIGQIIHYAHHAPVIARLWPELKMTSEKHLLVADHIADFSLAYLKSFAAKNSSKAKKKTRRAAK